VTLPTGEEKESEMVRTITQTELPVFDGQRYYGVIKSYNERRGFGFVACEETARIFGRDVYLSKEEASQLAKEPIVSGADSPAKSAVEEGQPPLKEGDFVSFQVQKKHRGLSSGSVSETTKAAARLCASRNIAEGRRRGQDRRER
jgi:cold shock CspA family protein